MLRNSRFFSEAAIVANYALGFNDPLEVGVNKGIRKLRQRRKDLCDRKGLEFNNEVFDKYAEFYVVVAKDMIKSFIKCAEEMK